MSLLKTHYTAIPKPATLARDAQAIFEADMAGAELHEHSSAVPNRKIRWYRKNRQRVLAQQKAYREKRKLSGRKA